VGRGKEPIRIQGYDEPGQEIMNQYKAREKT